MKKTFFLPISPPQAQRYAHKILKTSIYKSDKRPEHFRGVSLFGKIIEGPPAAAVNGCKLLRNAKIKAYIDEQLERIRSNDSKKIVLFGILQKHSYGRAV